MNRDLRDMEEEKKKSTRTFFCYLQEFLRVVFALILISILDEQSRKLRFDNANTPGSFIFRHLLYRPVFVVGQVIHWQEQQTETK